MSENTEPRQNVEETSPLSTEAASRPVEPTVVQSKDVGEDAANASAVAAEVEDPVPGIVEVTEPSAEADGVLPRVEPEVIADAEPSQPAATPDVPPVNYLDLDDAPAAQAVAPDLDAVEAPRPATPISAPPGFDLGDPEQVAQATYGQTQQSYAQPSYEHPSFADQQPYATPSAPPPYPPAPPTSATLPATTMSSADEDNWASAAHWSALVAQVVGLGFLGPLLVYLIKGPESPRVRAAAAESLNFEITFIIAMIVSVLTMIIVVGLVGVIVFPIVWLVLRIVAAVAAARGEDYRYPVNLRLVK